MPDEGLRSKMARLQREVEKLSTKHGEAASENIPSPRSLSSALHRRRSEILARRGRELDGILDVLKGGEEETIGFQAPDNATATAR